LKLFFLSINAICRYSGVTFMASLRDGPGKNRTVVAAALAVFATIASKANDDQSSNLVQFKFQPNSLVLSRSVYAGDANTVLPGQTLPPGCVAGNVTVPLVAGGSNQAAVTCGAAIDNGVYPDFGDRKLLARVCPQG
jgi:hypothetical protein